MRNCFFAVSYCFGICQIFGIGCPKNEAKGFQLIEKSANIGNAEGHK